MMLRKGGQKRQQLNNWLGELRDAMYYADDIIDLARSEGGKLLVEHPSSSRKPTKCGGISFSTCIPIVQKRHKIAVQIQDFNAELEKISKLGESFLKLQNMQPKTEVRTLKHMRTSHLVEPNLVGKDTLHACKRLVERVLTHKEEKAYKVCIVGTGGVGKTTLAQKIYNAPKLKGAFSKQAWICVSRDYSDVTLLKEILRNFGVHHEQGETLGELVSKLAAAIREKSFFLVLDDVWQPEVWTNVLRTPLHAAAAGVIIVTTRDDAVAHAIGVEDVDRVDSMSAEVGWELLWKSMNVNDEKDVEDLRNIGQGIVRKCGGLPLAIKVTARVLATKEKTENAWRKFINRRSWSVGNLPTELSGALYLSYDDLPRHLKQCFLYCALYPEDSTMSHDDLVMLWVAEGFIEEQHGQLLEETAEEYYYELIRRNLLQPDGRYFDQTRCKMHDLLRQLACYLSREECFIGDPESLGTINMSRMRRLTVVTKKDILVLPSMANGEAKVRTFQTDQQPRRVEDTFFMRFPRLRILELSDSLVHSIPDYIGKLIHLRLLDLDGTCVSCLLESISSLINLQILNLQRCNALCSLPLAITQLSNLRRLGLAGTPINHVPEGICRLKYLNDLGEFPVGGVSDDDKTADGWMLEELEHLSQLRWLEMIKLERVALYTTGSVLADKKYLQVLNLSCTEHTDVPYSEEDVSITEKVLDQLIPPRNLEDLLINGFFGWRYQTCLGSTHLSSLKHLKLVNCKSCMHLPPIGQLDNLKYLKIVGAAKVTKIGPEFVGCRGANPRSMVTVAFPKLELLVIKNLHNWEEWSFVEEEDAAGAAATEGSEDGDAEMRKGEALSPKLHLLPQLKKLELGGCPKLRALPRHLGQHATSFRELHLRGASCLKVVEDLQFLSENLLIAGCDGLERVSNLPQLRELRLHDSLNLRHVEGLSGLQQLWLTKNMCDASLVWVAGLQEQHRELHGEAVDVYTWPEC